MTRKLLLAGMLALTVLSACTPAVTPGAESDPTATSVPPAPTEAPPSPTLVPSPTTAPPPTGPPASAPLTFTDDLGREVVLQGPAQAIVTLGPSALEGFFAVGAGAQVVGREEFSTYPEEALEITNIGSLFGELPAETILALEPDLVLAPQIISPEQVSALEELGLTVYWQANPQDLEGLYGNLEELAALSGRAEEAAALIGSLQARVAAVDQALESLEARPTVFYELDATDPQNPFTVGQGTYIDHLITRAGGENIGAVLEGEFAQISSEEVIIQDPQVILLADAAYGITVESVGERAGWEGIDAVVNDRVYSFDPFLVSVPGPRLVDGLEALAALLHPERYP